MLNDFRKSVQLILHERITNPLSGALLFSWFAWNWRIPYFLFMGDSSLTLESRINYTETHFVGLGNSLIFPIVTAAFLVGGYPYVTNLSLKVWLWYRRRANRIRNEMEGNELLTLAESIELRREMDGLESRFAESMKSKDERIRVLSVELAQLREKLNSQVNEDPFPGINPSELAKKILLRGTKEGGDGMVRLVDHSQGVTFMAGNEGQENYELPQEKAALSAAVKDLVGQGLVEFGSQGVYEITDLGFKFAKWLRSSSQGTGLAGGKLLP